MNIPRIDTSHLPGNVLLANPLSESIARLDAIAGDDIGSPSHAQLVQQVINDARDSGFDILTL